MRPPVLLASLALALLALTVRLLPQPAFEALYGRRIYPAVTVILDSLTGWTWLPLGAMAVPALVGLLSWRALAPRRRRPWHWRLVRLGLLAVTIISSYYLLWGANYRRPSAASLLGVSAGSAQTGDLEELREYLLAWIGAGAEPADEPTDPGFVRDPVPEAATGDRADRSVRAQSDRSLATVAAALEALAGEAGFPARVDGPVKRLPSGSLLSAGYAGMLFPFTVEPQIDDALMGASRVWVGAHELAHRAGFASEQDADLAATIAAFRSGDEYAAYALSLALLARMLPVLTPQERVVTIEALPPRAQEDLELARAITVRYYRPSLGRRVTAIYDRLLRGQGVAGGVAQYGYWPRTTAAALEAGILPPPPPPRRPASPR